MSSLIEIKQRLRAMMNGPVSASMRQKGLNYRLNYGVELPRLLELAQELPHTYELACELWKQDCRELRILASLLMPIGTEGEGFASDLAEVWIEQMRFTEEAEMTSMNLLVRLPDASEKAFQWIAREEVMFQLCGYLVLGRLLSRGAQLSPRDRDELRDQAASCLASTTAPALRAAAHRVLLRME